MTLKSYLLRARVMVPGIAVLGALVIFAIASSAEAATNIFVSQMDMGAKGSQVVALQTALASDSSLYPQGLITGYYGSLTAAAVARFQVRYGLPAVGRVGPLTLAQLNAVVNADGTIGGAVAAAPTISLGSISVNNTSATIPWSTDQTTTGTVFYSTSPLIVAEATSPTSGLTVSGANMQNTTGAGVSQTVVLSGLQPSTIHYYMVRTVNANGMVSVTWPSFFKTNP